MEKKYKRVILVPFDYELAKKIQAGKIEGRIFCGDKLVHRILCIDAYGNNPVIYTRMNTSSSCEIPFLCRLNELNIEPPAEPPICNNPEYSKCKMCSNWHCSDCQYNAPKYEFKPFEQVLVRDDYNSQWTPALFQLYSETGIRNYYASGQWYFQCIPYKGNEHLAGTTDELSN